jgi:hypothetical protein
MQCEEELKKQALGKLQPLTETGVHLSSDSGNYKRSKLSQTFWTLFCCDCWCWWCCFWVMDLGVGDTPAIYHGWKHECEIISVFFWGHPWNFWYLKVSNWGQGTHSTLRTWIQFQIQSILFWIMRGLSTNLEFLIPVAFDVGAACRWNWKWNSSMGGQS